MVASVPIICVANQKTWGRGGGEMEVKPYTISTVIAALAAGGMGLAAASGSMRPMAQNNSRMEALSQIVNYLKADNCLNVESQSMPTIGKPIQVDGQGQISTSCLYYPQYKRFAWIAQLNNQLQVVYLYTNTEVKKSNGSDQQRQDR